MSDRLGKKFGKKYYFKNFWNLIQVFFFVINNISINITIDINNE